MTVSATTTRLIYDGDDATTSFPYTWKITDSSHNKVVHTSAIGVETIWTENTHYTVTGVDSDTGGNVVVEAAYTPATGTKLTVYLYVPFTQETDYEENDAFPAETHEEALDKLTRQNLYQEDVSSRCLKIPTSDSTDTDTEIPTSTSRAGKMLGFDASGDITTSSIVDTSAFYNTTELNAGQLNTLYYTETELDGGILNSLYYTETEVDALTSGTISNVVEDTSPQLGGNLDLNTNNIVYSISNTNSFISSVTVSGATTAGQPLYITTGGVFALADCAASGCMPCRGLSTISGTGTNDVYFGGIVKNTDWSWTIGDNIYVSTSGTLTQTTPSTTGDKVQCIGYAIASTVINLNINDMYIEVS